jgi:enoyl-CoA hydratase/carnithine racemase
LAQSRVVSVAKLRGRARGHGSELALACDIRFASKEKAVLAQTEVGGAVVPGGGATEWLCPLAGRSRALEIICGANDFDADTAEKYGWVNRSIPDADLDAFVDDFARRVASFEKRATRRRAVGRATTRPTPLRASSVAVVPRRSWKRSGRGIAFGHSFMLHFGQRRTSRSLVSSRCPQYLRRQTCV